MYCTIKGWNFPHRLVIYFISHNGFLVWSPVVYILLFNEASVTQTIGLCVFRKQLNDIEIIFISMCAYICASVCLYVYTVCVCLSVCLCVCLCMYEKDTAITCSYVYKVSSQWYMLREENWSFMLKLHLEWRVDYLKESFNPLAGDQEYKWA